MKPPKTLEHTAAHGARFLAVWYEPTSKNSTRMIQSLMFKSAIAQKIA